MSHGTGSAPARIVLVGFMASGKSTIGPLLARRLGWSFVDIDAEVARRTGLPPAVLIRERGEPAFRQLEGRLTAETIQREGVVVAPGGGWVTRPGAADKLPPRTVRVWLRVGIDEALRRAARDATDRPLLGPPEGRLERAAALLRDREPLYAAAEVVVDVNRRDPARIVDEIVGRLDLDREANER